MVGATATATEMQNNFGRYLSIVIGGAEVIVTKNGKEVQGCCHLLSDGFSDRDSQGGCAGAGNQRCGAEGKI